MEYDQLSGYDKYILLTQQTRHMKGNMQAFGVFNVIMDFLEKCSKSDAKVMHYQERYFDKPVTRNQAKQALEKVSKGKWDAHIMTVARFLELDTRV